MWIAGCVSTEEVNKWCLSGACLCAVAAGSTWCVNMVGPQKVCPSLHGCLCGGSLCQCAAEDGLRNRAADTALWSPQRAFHFERSRFVIHIVSQVYFSPNTLTFLFNQASKSRWGCVCLQLYESEYFTAEGGDWLFWLWLCALCCGWCSCEVPYTRVSLQVRVGWAWLWVSGWWMSAQRRSLSCFCCWGAASRQGAVGWHCGAAGWTGWGFITSSLWTLVINLYRPIQVSWSVLDHHLLWVNSCWPRDKWFSVSYLGTQRLPEETYRSVLCLWHSEVSLLCLQLFTKAARSPSGTLMELQAGGRQQAALAALCSPGFSLVPCGGNFPVA